MSSLIVIGTRILISSQFLSKGTGLVLNLEHVSLTKLACLWLALQQASLARFSWYIASRASP